MKVILYAGTAFLGALAQKNVGNVDDRQRRMEEAGRLIRTNEHVIRKSTPGRGLGVGDADYGRIMPLSQACDLADGLHITAEPQRFHPSLYIMVDTKENASLLLRSITATKYPVFSPPEIQPQLFTQS